MKQVIVNYALALLACLVIGLICALMKCFSGWYFFLFSFPISLGWIPFALIYRATTPEISEDVGWLLVSALIILIVILVAGFAFISAGSFWEITFGAGMFSAIISTLILIYRIRNKSWKLNISKTESASVLWCRFFQYKKIRFSIE